MSVKQGQIVWGWFSEPNGRNAKRRRAVVLTETEDICDDEPLSVAVISTKFDPERIPSNWIPAPWHRDGHAVTSLKEPCVIKCDWIIPVNCKDVLLAGHVSGKILFRVKEAVANLL